MIAPLVGQFAAACAGGDFLGFPKWYKYLDSQQVTNTLGNKACAPKITSLSDIWLILAAVIEMLLRIGALFAIAYVIYGSVQFITSQGDPSKTQNARNTIFNALIGLVISIAAATIVSYIAGGFK
ncbi:MAG TPA: hypothetical protein VJR27_05020 [Candidatus Saccharimonadales bacterium]|nr:hypothetical protein [Candidatus Saccharimonadales bacterium]